MKRGKIAIYRAKVVNAPKAFVKLGSYTMKAFTLKQAKFQLKRLGLDYDHLRETDLALGVPVDIDLTENSEC